MKCHHLHIAILCAPVLSREVLAFCSTPNALSHQQLSGWTSGVTKRDERESQHKRQSTATYQDEAYEMFLSNIKKDLIESWKEEMGRSMADEVPSFGLDTAYGGDILSDDEKENAVATIESESDGTNSRTFLLSLSTGKLQERLREAGLPIDGGSNLDLVQRLLGEEAEPSATKQFLSTLTSDQLRERLREAGLPIAGQKATLVDRLLGNCT